MYPVLFTLKLPEWLLNLLPFLPESISPKSYGTMIALGILASWLYATNQAKKLGVKRDTITDMYLWLIVASYVGGRFFFFFEYPDYYFGTPSNMLEFSGSGFVFYGSMVFVFPTLWWFFKRNKLPALPMLDIVAIGGAMVHIFGRMGCFLAGCCHGVPTDSWLGVTYTHSECMAKPLHTPLHPTQLYSIFMISIIIVVLLLLKKRQQFAGQLFPVYLMIYAVGRSIIEEFRGDEARGFIFDNWFSHSQFISVFIFLGALAFYLYLHKKYKASKSK